jgi:hypothetical protein
MGQVCVAQILVSDILYDRDIINLLISYFVNCAGNISFAIELSYTPQAHITRKVYIKSYADSFITVL